MITLYQIKLTDEDYTIANTKGFEAVPRVYAKSIMQFGARKWQPEYAEHYTAVARVYVNDLDEAFEETNLWENEHLIERIPGTRCHSSSVGDIFEMNGQFFIVDNFGFTQLENFKG